MLSVSRTFQKDVPLNYTTIKEYKESDASKGSNHIIEVSFFDGNNSIISLNEDEFWLFYELMKDKKEYSEASYENIIKSGFISMLNPKSNNPVGCLVLFLFVLFMGFCSMDDGEKEKVYQALGDNDPVKKAIAVEKRKQERREQGERDRKEIMKKSELYSNQEDDKKKVSLETQEKYNQFYQPCVASLSKKEEEKKADSDFDFCDCAAKLATVRVTVERSALTHMTADQILELSAFQCVIPATYEAATKAFYSLEKFENITEKQKQQAIEMFKESKEFDKMKYKLMHSECMKGDFDGAEYKKYDRNEFCKCISKYGIYQFNQMKRSISEKETSDVISVSGIRCLGIQDGAKDPLLSLSFE